MKKLIGASWAEMFELRGDLPKKTRIIIFCSGVLFGFLVWLLVAELKLINDYIVPHPFSVITGLGTLLFGGRFLFDFLVSLEFNLLGYIWAIIWAIPIGFLIGLFPFFDALWGPWLKALRFWPITAALCAFMAAFGTGTNMKIQFLAVTILVFAIPAVAQRIKNVNETQVQKVKTLGFTKWQTIRRVFIPQGIGWSWDDITNLVAISWTYIVFVEMINKSQGGVGSFIYDAYYRDHQTNLLWATMIFLIIWGVIQDLGFRGISNLAFAWKHRKEA